MIASDEVAPTNPTTYTQPPKPLLETGEKKKQYLTKQEKKKIKEYLICRMCDSSDTRFVAKRKVILCRRCGFEWSAKIPTLKDEVAQ